MNQAHESRIGKDQQTLCKLTKVAQALGQGSELRVKESMTIPEFLPCGSAQHGWRVPEPHRAAFTAASWTFLRSTESPVLLEHSLCWLPSPHGPYSGDGAGTRQAPNASWHWVSAEKWGAPGQREFPSSFLKPCIHVQSHNYTGQAATIRIN